MKNILPFKPHVLVGLIACSASSALYADATHFADGARVPQYLQQFPSGSADDLRTSAVYDDVTDTWTLTFRRNLLTGDASHDVQFALGGTYAFQLAKFDHVSGSATALNDANGGHIGNKTDIYSVTIPDSLPATLAGKKSLTFSSLPEKLTSLSGNLLGSNEIEITMTWSDSSKDDAVGYWEYTLSNAKKHQGSWLLRSATQDQLSMVWDIQNDNFTTAGNCEQMCHLGSLSMATQNGTVDNWQWQAAKSGPIGHAVDGYWEKFTAQNPSGIEFDAGLPAFVANSLVNGHPKYQHESHPGGAQSSRLFLMPAGVKPAVKPTAFPLDDWKTGDNLPNSVFRPIRGNIADVRSFSAHDGKQWTVTFRRKLNTGGDRGHDITFEKGHDYSFLYTYHDNSDHDYSEGLLHALTDPETPFTMHIPDAPGALEFPVKPPKLNAISGRLLDSDEIEITISWPDSTRNDNKSHWTYDAEAADASKPWWRVGPYAVGTYPARTIAKDEVRSQSTFSSDRFMIVWDMQGDQFQTTGNCQEMCHTDANPAVASMATKAGILDSWNWTGNSVVSGYPSDTYWDTTGDSVSDGGSQSASVTNTATSPTTPTSDDMDTVRAGGLTYTAQGGAGNSAEWLYADSPQADGWNRGTAAFVQSITKAVLNNVRKADADKITITGTFDEGDAEFDPASVLTSIKVGAIEETIASGKFIANRNKSKYSYVSKSLNAKGKLVVDGKVAVTFELSPKPKAGKAKKPGTFSITLGKRSLNAFLVVDPVTGKANTVDFQLKVGALDGAPQLDFN